MILLDDIRSGLVNQSADLSNTLRKAKILASAIRLPEFGDWVDSELGGYKDRNSLPSYRVVPSNINLGYFSGPLGSGWKNVVLPTDGLPHLARDFAENLHFYDGVGALEAQAGKDTQVKWSQEMILFARQYIQMSGMVLVDAHKPIPSYIVPGILDQIKNKLLDFVLALEENNVTAEDLDNRTVEKDVARNLFHVHIYGDQNVVAAGEQVTQQVTTVQQGNVESLLKCLRSLNVEDTDLDELRAAIEIEPAISEARYGPRVKAWLGEMVAKVATGTWKTGLDAGMKTLTNALNQYYGL